MKRRPLQKADFGAGSALHTPPCFRVSPPHTWQHPGRQCCYPVLRCIAGTTLLVNWVSKIQKYFHLVSKPMLSTVLHFKCLQPSVKKAKALGLPVYFITSFFLNLNTLIVTTLCWAPLAQMEKNPFPVLAESLFFPRHGIKNAIIIPFIHNWPRPLSIFTFTSNMPWLWTDANELMELS